MAYDPSKHLIRVQGNREYLPVAQRLVWFREVHPDWGIQCELVQLDWEAKRAVCKATIRAEDGRIIAEGYKQEDAKGFPDFLEKSSTGAVGRALALCGFGTQFAPELDEGGDVADAPREARGTREPTAAPTVTPAADPKAAPPSAAPKNGRPEGCTCPPACKEHQIHFKGCALNQKGDAA